MFRPQKRDRADEILAEVKSSLIASLLLLAEEYCSASGSSRSALGRLLFGRGGHLDDLAEGRRDLATGTYERTLFWFSDHWPESVAWPDGIDRPAVQAPEAAE